MSSLAGAKGGQEASPFAELAPPFAAEALMGHVAVLIGNQPIHMAYTLAPLLLRLQLPSPLAAIRLSAQAVEAEEQKEQLGW